MKKFELAPLPYAYDALLPVLGEDTLHCHHDKHHQGYVNNLNAAAEGTEFAEMHCAADVIRNLSKAPADKVVALRNNAGGTYNHNLYWNCMIPGGSKTPVGKLAEAINKDFGSFEAMQEAFNKAGAGRFGSGWAWLVLRDGKLVIESTPNQDNPLETGGVPILGNDVWEHAYYLQYQNRRADYLKDWWTLLNWEVIGKRYEAALEGAFCFEC